MAKIDGLQDEKVGPAFQMCWRIGNQHSLTIALTFSVKKLLTVLKNDKIHISYIFHALYWRRTFAQ